MSEIEAQFNKAVYMVKKGRPSGTDNSRKLQYYKYFKQITVGDVQGSQPWTVQVEARMKWDAWAEVKGEPAEECMKKYIALVNEEHPGWEDSQTVQDMPADYSYKGGE